MNMALRIIRSLPFLCASLCLWFGGAGVDAEVYQKIGPLDTLADIKLRFPSADYKQLKPAWAQEWDVMYSVSGEGLSGQIIVKFNDGRPSYKKMLQDDPESKNKEMLEKLATETNEEALSVEWVRWVPSSPIPLQRFISKYGKPTNSGFSDEDLQPYRNWSKGLTAYLSDDEKAVLHVDFTFTREERRKAFQEKYGFVPDSLKEVPQLE